MFVAQVGWRGCGAAATVLWPCFPKGRDRRLSSKVEGGAGLSPCLGRAAGWTSYQYGPLTEDSNQAELPTRPSVQVLGSLIGHG